MPETIRPDETDQFRVVVSLDMQGYGRIVSGLDPAGVQDVQEHIRRFIHKACAAAGAVVKDVLWNWTGDGSLMAFRDAAQADTFATAFLEAGDAWNHDPQRDEDRTYFYFRVGVDADFVRISETGLVGDTVVKAVRLQGAAGPGEVLISPFVYRLLSPARRQQYGPRERVRGKKGEGLYETHRKEVAAPDPDFAFTIREGGPTPRGLYVAPVGDENGDRAAKVLNDCVLPASRMAGLEIQTLAMDRSGALSRTTLHALRAEPVAIVYLGKPDPQWNPTVMFALGVRLAESLPVVLLRHVDDDAYFPPLPFELSEQYMVNLPAEPAGPKAVEAARNSLVPLLRQARTLAAPWDSPHAVTTLEFDFASRKNVIIDASTEAERLFDMQGRMIGAKVSDLILGLEERMSHEQYRAFSEEQARLMAILRSPLAANDVRVPVATIPVLFEDHRREEFRQRAYLPIIVGHARFGNVLRLRVLYIDVTSSISRQNDSFVCHLSDSPRVTDLPLPETEP